MKSTDLRIGNYIKSDDGIICIVSRIESKDYTNWNSGDCFSITALELNTKDDYLNVKNDKWQPILLTEKILLKCGFFYDIDSETFKIHNSTLQIDIYNLEIPEAIVFGEVLRNIKHLHQLQNLFFTLTGQELKVKL